MGTEYTRPDNWRHLAHVAGKHRLAEKSSQMTRESVYAFGPDPLDLFAKGTQGGLDIPRSGPTNRPPCTRPSG